MAGLEGEMRGVEMDFGAGELGPVNEGLVGGSMGLEFMPSTENRIYICWKIQ